MNLEYDIARRIHSDNNQDKAISHSAVVIAIIGIAVGVMVMLLSVSIVIGFKHEVRDKVIAFGSHIQVSNYDSNQTYETKPILATDSLLKSLMKTSNVHHVQRFATKPGIIKTNDDVQGIILKGIDKDFDWRFYKPNIIEGDTLTLKKNVPSDDPFANIASNEVLISKYQSLRLKLKVGDTFLTYFVQEDGIRARKFKIVGVFCTNFEDYDKQFIITDLRHIQQLNNWTDNQVSGVEILVDDYNKLDETTEEIYNKTAYRQMSDGSTLITQSIEELNPDVFSWLSMLDVNVWIILTLMMIVASFNMISGLLILILEKTNMIGILKALGCRNWSIRKIFLYQSCFLIGKGLIIGNIIGLALILIQNFTHVIPLDAETYYVSYVPTELNLWYFLAINAGTFILSLLVLIIPSMMISRISPATSIRFD